MMDKPATILVVEDDATHALLIMRAFEEVSLPKDVHWVDRGDKALDYLFNRGEYSDKKKNPRPDLVLLDLRLPIVDGHEVLKEIKSSEDLRVLPVIILTTSQNKADMEKAYSNYANSYLVKPMGADKFKQLIEDTGLYWLKWNQRIPGTRDS
jgi:CheY-like chemotaxis protein